MVKGDHERDMGVIVLIVIIITVVFVVLSEIW